MCRYSDVRKIFLRAHFLMMLASLASGAVFGQSRPVDKNHMSNLSDAQVVDKIRSRDEKEATQAVNEAFQRGARIMPLLLKYKGDRRFYYGDRLGSKRNGDYKIGPPETREVDVEETRIETVEIAAIYLVSSIYFDSLEFAHSAFLIDTTIPEEESEPGNTQVLIDRAWNSTESWLLTLESDCAVDRKRAEQRDPLYDSGTKFYGTTSRRSFP